MSSLVRRAPLAALAFLVVACADPLAPALPRRTASADLMLPSKLAQIMCGTYIVAYTPPVDSSFAAVGASRALSLPDATAIDDDICGGTELLDENR
jgi:hypothetical protein